MSMRPLSLSTAADSVNCGPRGGDKAWTKKFTCLGVYVFFPGLNIYIYCYWPNLEIEWSFVVQA